MIYTKDNFIITDDISMLDMNYVVAALQSTYWAEKRSRETIEKSIKNSVVLSLFVDKKPIGLARVISDFATYAYICDVYIEPIYRGRGLGIWLMECVMSHPATNVDLIVLATRDAHGLYKKLGFMQCDVDTLKKLMFKRTNQGGALERGLGKNLSCFS